MTESHDDLVESRRVLAQMQQELSREAAITADYEQERRLNDEELGRLGAQYGQFKAEYDKLTEEFEGK